MDSIKVRLTCAQRSECQKLIASLYDGTNILTRDDALLDWQHRSRDGTYTFSAASTAGGVDSAVLGYIPLSHWDPDIKLNAAAGVIWGAAVPGVGLILLLRLLASPEGQRFYGMALSKAAREIYLLLGMTIERVDHFFILGPTFNPLDWGGEIGAVPSVPHTKEKYSIREMFRNEIHGIWEPMWDKIYQTRSASFYQSRFFDHPSYVYRVFLVTTGHDRSLITVRVVESERGRSIKVLDILTSGDPSGVISSAMESILTDFECSFADYYVIDRCTPGGVAAMGLHHVDDYPHIVIPNYFEPFIAENIEIEATANFPLTFITRSDGDQDRPSRI